LVADTGKDHKLAHYVAQEQEQEHQRTKEQVAARIRDPGEQRTWIPKDEDKSLKEKRMQGTRSIGHVLLTEDQGRGHKS
jgi:hypothetical protein